MSNDELRVARHALRGRLRRRGHGVIVSRALVEHFHREPERLLRLARRVAVLVRVARVDRAHVVASGDRERALAPVRRVVRALA